MPAVVDLTQEGNSLSEIDSLAKEYRRATTSIGATSLNLFDENFIQDILHDIRKLETNSYVPQCSPIVSLDNYDLRPTDQFRKREFHKDAKVRSRIGEGFDMDSEEEDEDEEGIFEPLENYDPNLAATFDDDDDDEDDEDDIQIQQKTKRVKFVEVTLPGPNVKFEHDVETLD